MSNVDAMFESDFWRACDLEDGKTFTGKIERVEADELQIAGTSKKKRKPVVHFSNSKKALAVNKTNAATLKEALGKNTSGWIGATVTLYQINDAKLGKKTVDAVRLKNVKRPGGKRSQKANNSSAATRKDLEYALAGIEGCANEDELGEFLASIRKKQWNKAQSDEIKAAKEARLEAITAPEPEPATETKPEPETAEEPATEQAEESKE